MYQQAISGIIPGIQAGMLSQVQGTGRIGAIQGYGNTSRQSNSLEIMRVYVIQEAPRSFIRSQRTAVAEGTYREGGDPNRYREWANQETQQSAVTGMRRFEMFDDDFIQKHLDRLSDRGEGVLNSTQYQQPAEEVQAEPAPTEETTGGETEQYPCPPLGGQTEEAKTQTTKGSEDARCPWRNASETKANPVVSGNIGTQLIR